MALSSKPVLERSDVLEAIWHSQGCAVKCCSKEEMLEKTNPWAPSVVNGKRKSDFFQGQPSWTLGSGVSKGALEGTEKD